VIVVDASALIDFLLGRRQAIEAVTAALGEHDALHAPELVEPETLNALRRLAQNGVISELRAAEAVEDLGDARLIRYPHAPLRARVWDLRDQLSAYDATYLALAEGLGAELVTGDAGLAERARGTLGDRGVRLI
jgi:predicted nucleic acid-binding protein